MNTSNTKINSADMTTPEVEALAEQFLHLFEGNKRQHGTHGNIRTPNSENGKCSPDCWTKQGPATLQLWIDHLSGKSPLGIVPILDDNTCHWGCIDVDQYGNFTLEKIAKKVTFLDLPLVVCRSKSGGAHIYAFFNGAIPAFKVREFLSEHATILGLRKVEIFPKQERLEFIGRDRESGNWLNMPYFNLPHSLRAATDGINLFSAEEFLAKARHISLSLAGLDAYIDEPQTSPGTTETDCESLTEPYYEDAANSGEDFANKMLDHYSSKIRKSIEGERNIILNKATFHLATMVPRGWVDKAKISDTMLAAALECGLMEFEERKKTLNTVRGALKRGMTRPHRELQRRGSKRRDATDIITPVAAEIELFRTPDKVAYADIEVAGHRESWAVRSKEFSLWLTRRAYEQSGKVPGESAMASTLNMIEAKALFGSVEREICLRVADFDGRIYLDLCDEHWRVVEISRDGWKVVHQPPVRFRRSKGMLPLPLPVREGNLGELRRFLNVATEDDFALAVAWLIGAMSPQGPYPILATSGPEGAAKTSFCKVLRALIDPHVAPLRTPQKDNRSLFVAAKSNHVMGFDNVSFIPEWMSDTLCRIATGGGHAERTNYTDDEETLFVAERPIILNGIPEVVTRPDLANRTISVTLEPIEKADRRPETELWADFEAARSRILGVLLDAVAHGLRRLPDIYLDDLPRMADFAIWVSACEGALPWDAGTILRAYNENSDATADLVSEGDDVAQAIVAFMREQTERRIESGLSREWTGTAKELLSHLNNEVIDRDEKCWPRTPRALRSRLNRSARILKEHYRITIQKSRQAHEGRIFTMVEHDVQEEDRVCQAF